MKHEVVVAIAADLPRRTIEINGRAVEDAEAEAIDLDHLQQPGEAARFASDLVRPREGGTPCLEAVVGRDAFSREAELREERPCLRHGEVAALPSRGIVRASQFRDRASQIRL